MREVALLVVLSISSLAMGQPQPACPIVPLPKVYRETGRSVQLLGPEALPFGAYPSGAYMENPR